MEYKVETAEVEGLGTILKLEATGEKVEFDKKGNPKKVDDVKKLEFVVATNDQELGLYELAGTEKKPALGKLVKGIS